MIIKLFRSNYTCREYYDVDINLGGIEIIDECGERLGSMLNISLPDENDKDEMDKFKDAVENWIIENE